MARGKVFPAERARSLTNPLRRVVQSPKRTVAAMGVAADDRVLEVGSGPGFFSPHLASAAARGQVVVLDLQLGMLGRARERLAEHRHASLVAADATRLPFRSGQFDLVVLATMLGEIPDVVGGLSEVHRVLRLGGLAAVAETRRDSDFIPLGRLRQLFEDHGFLLGDRHGPPFQYVARFRAI